MTLSLTYISIFLIITTLFIDYYNIKNNINISLETSNINKLNRDSKKANSLDWDDVKNSLKEYLNVSTNTSIYINECIKASENGNLTMIAHENKYKMIYDMIDIRNLFF
jgi:hypothetical protein